MAFRRKLVDHLLKSPSKNVKVECEMSFRELPANHYSKNGGKNYVVSAIDTETLLKSFIYR